MAREITAHRSLRPPRPSGNALRYVRVRGTCIAPERPLSDVPRQSGSNDEGDERGSKARHRLAVETKVGVEQTAENPSEGQYRKEPRTTGMSRRLSGSGPLAAGAGRTAISDPATSGSELTAGEFSDAVSAVGVASLLSSGSSFSPTARRIFRRQPASINYDLSVVRGEGVVEHVRRKGDEEDYRHRDAGVLQVVSKGE